MLPLNRDDLLAAMARGERFTFRPFYGHTPRADGRLSDSCFSQWYAQPFEVHGRALRDRWPGKSSPSPG